jgi:DNA helicase IV
VLEEERRLFYVAITRAKEKLFLITEKGNESSFLKEIPDSFTVKTTTVLAPVVEKVLSCENCFSQLDSKVYAFCPYCGFQNSVGYLTKLVSKNLVGTLFVKMSLLSGS